MRPAILANVPNLAGLLMALQRRWLLATVLGLLGGAVAAGSMWFLQKTTYTARTVLHISSRPPRIMFDVRGQEDFGNYQRNQICAGQNPPRAE